MYGQVLYENFENIFKKALKTKKMHVPAFAYLRNRPCIERTERGIDAFEEDFLAFGIVAGSGF